MRVLITGGTGFIGSSLALRHARKGDTVIALGKQTTRPERENATELIHDGVHVEEGDIREQGHLESCLRGKELVYHVAAAMREATLPESDFWAINVDATRHLLEIAQHVGVGRIVYCSSIGAMGKSPAKPASENSPCEPEDIYQKTKHAAEQLCLDFQRTRGLPITVIRPADVYGPRDRRLLKLFRAIKRGYFVMLGTGQNEHHMVYIDDLVDAFVVASSAPAAVGEVFIIAGEAPVTLNALVATIAQELGASPPHLRVPLWPIRKAARVVEAACSLLSVSPPIYERRVDFFRTDFAFDISKAKRVLHFSPVFTLGDGIAATRRWYEAQHLL